MSETKSEWVDAGAENSLDEGEHLVVEVDGVEVALFRVAGSYHAIEDLCTHDGAEIASGQLEGCEIICPRHGARFCLKSGRVLSPPAYEDLTIYEVRVEKGRLQIRYP
jgi:3-phenylpropionate/trans-cinnamate dioxygenase ferredoxin subunit